MRPILRYSSEIRSVRITEEFIDRCGQPQGKDKPVQEPSTLLELRNSPSNTIHAPHNIKIIFIITMRAGASLLCGYDAGVRI